MLIQLSSTDLIKLNKTKKRTSKASSKVWVPGSFYLFMKLLQLLFANSLSWACISIGTLLPCILLIINSINFPLLPHQVKEVSDTQMVLE